MLEKLYIMQGLIQDMLICPNENQYKKINSTIQSTDTHIINSIHKSKVKKYKKVYANN